MSFMNSYKQLEKLCNEIYHDSHGVSSYIDDMTNLSLDLRYILDRNDDLKQLKHYRWVRNQIVHEPNCTEENMCEPEDVVWIDNFYSRIMKQTDPLSLYHQSINAKQTTHSQNSYSDISQQQIYKLKQYKEYIQQQDVYPKLYRQQENKKSISRILGVIVLTAIILTFSILILR